MTLADYFAAQLAATPTRPLMLDYYLTASGPSPVKMQLPSTSLEAAEGTIVYLGVHLGLPHFEYA